MTDRPSTTPAAHQDDASDSGPDYLTAGLGLTRTHPAWCSKQACAADDTFPDNRQHHSEIPEVPLTLHMPWRDEADGEWNSHVLTIQVTQGVREVEPRVSLWSETAGEHDSRGTGMQLDMTVAEFHQFMAAAGSLLSQLDHTEEV